MNESMPDRHVAESSAPASPIVCRCVHASDLIATSADVMAYVDPECPIHGDAEADIPWGDTSAALLEIAGRGCYTSTAGIGSCWSNGRLLSADDEAHSACEPCIAWAALGGVRGTDWQPPRRNGPSGKACTSGSIPAPHPDRLVVRRVPGYGWGLFHKGTTRKAHGDEYGPWYATRSDALAAKRGARPLLPKEDQTP